MPRQSMRDGLVFVFVLATSCRLIAGGILPARAFFGDETIFLSLVLRPSIKVL